MNARANGAEATVQRRPWSAHPQFWCSRPTNGRLPTGRPWPILCLACRAVPLPGGADGTCPVLAAFVVAGPKPAAAGAACPCPGCAGREPALRDPPTALAIVAPVCVRGLRDPLALRARGALPSFSVRLRRRAGGRPSAERRGD